MFSGRGSGSIAALKSLVENWQLRSFVTLRVAVCRIQQI
jgi:hypothetical protein